MKPLKMYRQLFLECDSKKPLHAYICINSDDKELTDYETMLISTFKIDFTIFKYHIPLVYPISLIKKIIKNKFEITEDFLMYSKEFNIEIQLTNSANIFNPLKPTNKNIITCNDYSLFSVLNTRSIDMSNICINFIKFRDIYETNVIPYSIPLTTKYSPNEYEFVIKSFIDNENFNYTICNDELLILYKISTYNDIFCLNNNLKYLNWDCLGIFKTKNYVVLNTNTITDSDILIYTKGNSTIIIKKKKILFNDMKDVFLVQKILNIDSPCVSKKKTKIIMTNFCIKFINPLLNIFLENDQIIKNIKKTYNKELKIFFNKNNFIFISNGYKNDILVYISKILYSFNGNGSYVKRDDKIDNFFISRTCQNLKTKKRIPSIINYDPTFKKKNDNYYLSKDDKVIFFNKGLYYKCISDDNYNYLGFLKKFDDNCIPCCYLKVQHNSVMFNKCMNLDISKEIYNLNLLSPKRLISHSKQLKLLPDYLNKLFNKNNKITLSGNSLLKKTDGYILLSYNTTKKLSDNLIVISNNNIIFDIFNFKNADVIYKQNDYFEKFVHVVKSKDSDELIIGDVDVKMIRDMIIKKLNNKILYKHNNIKISNYGIYYKDKQIIPKTKFIVSKNYNDLEYNYNKKRESLKTLFKNVIINNFDNWAMYKLENIEILNKITKNNSYEKYLFFDS